MHAIVKPQSLKSKDFLRLDLRDDLEVMDARETLVANLEALMKANPDAYGTQTKIAQLSGVDQTSVGKILRGVQHPTTSVLQRLARAFGVEVWQLFTPNLKPPRELSPFARDMAEMIDSRLVAQGAREAREAIRAEIIYRFGPGSELRPVESEVRADTTPPHPFDSGKPAEKVSGRP